MRGWMWNPSPGVIPITYTPCMTSTVESFLWERKRGEICLLNPWGCVWRLRLQQQRFFVTRVNIKMWLGETYNFLSRCCFRGMKMKSASGDKINEGRVLLWVIQNSIPSTALLHSFIEDGFQFERKFIATEGLKRHKFSSLSISWIHSRC